MTRTACAILLAVTLSAPTSAPAVGIPLPATSHVLKPAKTSEIVNKPLVAGTVFALPTPGGSTDPTIVGGSVLWCRLDVPEACQSFDLPPAGWRGLGKPAGTKGYKYKGSGTPSDPCKSVVLEAKVIRASCKREDLPTPVGGAGVRWELTLGGDRYCAESSDTTLAAVKKNNLKIWKALRANPPEECPIDCGAIGDPVCAGDCGSGGTCTPDSSGCVCLYDTDPCGDTAPVCNGSCPPGEECVAIDAGLPFDSCTCTPNGVTPCGGPSDATCGGSCPDGDFCGSLSGKHGDFCSCLDPGATCEGTTPGSCPAGFQCAFSPPAGPWLCAPKFCSGTFPTCGGDCAPGESCQPVSIAGVADYCVCAPAGASCDASCGGLECPGSGVCSIDPSSQNCSCS